MAASLKKKFIKEFASAVQALVEGQKLVPTDKIAERAASELMKKSLLPDTMEFDEAVKHPLTAAVVKAAEEFAEGTPTDARATMVHAQSEVAWEAFQQIINKE